MLHLELNCMFKRSLKYFMQSVIKYYLENS